MLERDRGIRVDGCDLNQHALEKATSGKGRLLVYDVFDRNSEMLGAYDLLLLMDVIEHVDDDLEFVKVSLQHLKPDGLVVINVPAHMTFYSQYDEVAGHKRRYGVADMNLSFRQARLKPISIAQWGLFLLPALLMRKLILRLTPPEHTISVGLVPSNPFLHGILKRLQALLRQVSRSQCPSAAPCLRSDAVCRTRLPKWSSGQNQRKRFGSGAEFSCCYCC